MKEQSGVRHRRDWSRAELMVIAGPFVFNCLEIIEYSTEWAKKLGKEMALPSDDLPSKGRALIDIATNFNRAWSHLITTAFVDSGDFNTVPHRTELISRHDFGVIIIKNEEHLSSVFRDLIFCALHYGLALGRRGGSRTTPASNLSRRDFDAQKQHMQSALEDFFQSMVGLSWAEYIDMKSTENES